MKLGSLKSGRDGRLIVVSRDLSRFVESPAAIPTLQAALDAWDDVRGQLQALQEKLDTDDAFGSQFANAPISAPLPRAYQWADGSAYVNHVELVRRARGAEMPASFWVDPLMYQGASDCFLGPSDPIALGDEAWGCDMEAEICVVTGDVPQGADRQRCLEAIRLVGLVNDVSLRNLIPNELAKGFGFFQSKPASALSPVLVTTDELGSLWRDGKLHAPLLVHLNTEAFGRADAGVDMTFDFASLLGHVAKTRSLVAGSIVGSGTVSNRSADGGPGKPVASGGVGYSCIAEQRVVETIESGEPVTPFLRFGDRVRIEVLDKNGASVFGAIDQIVERF